MFTNLNSDPSKKPRFLGELGDLSHAKVSSGDLSTVKALRFSNAAGVTHEGTTALHRLSAATNAPIFSYIDGFFDGSIVGGSMHSVEKGMVVAASAAVRIARSSTRRAPRRGVRIADAGRLA